MKRFLLNDHLCGSARLVFNLLHVGAAYVFRPYADVWQAAPEMRLFYLGILAFWSLVLCTLVTEEWPLVTWGMAYTFLAGTIRENGVQHPFVLALAIHILISGVMVALVLLMERLNNVLSAR